MKHCSMLLVLVLSFSISLFAADPPSSYDLRNVGGHNYVTSVKSQQGGTCWTHGSCAAMEGNMLMTGAWTGAGESGEPNLAEYHLDWWNGFNQNNNDDLIPPDGEGLVVHEGGDYRVTSAYLSRGEGAVRDIDAQLFDDPPDRYLPSYHYFYVRDIEWYTVGTNLSNINLIKEKVMAEGVMGTCLYSSGSFLDGINHYQPPTDLNDPNHAVAIVGWDDNHVTQAPLPGAWLIKNSWGSWWGDNGYFWISYYDKHCGHHPEMGAISFQDVEPMRYDKIHYHDYHGWRHTISFIDEAFNVFTSDADQLLEAVSFYTATDNVTYTVTIYDRFEDFELRDPITTQTGLIEYTGFHTVDLDTPVLLDSAKTFYVYVQLSDGGHPIDHTSEVPVLLGSKYRTIVESFAKPGESYYFQNGNWFDLNDYDPTGNFCIKALATNRTKALGMSCTTDIPAYLASGEPLELDIEITDAGESLVAGTGQLHYRFDDGAYQTISLEHVSGTTYKTTLPGSNCGDVPQFYFSAQGSGGSTVYEPTNAPAVCHAMIIGALTISMADDFETDQGWFASGYATDGLWERGVPVGGGDRGDPSTDFDGSGSCYLTANDDGDSDVDNGYAYLETPILDLTGLDPIVHYALWYSNNTSGDPNNDVFRIYITNDLGFNYTLVDTVGPTTVNRWFEYEFRVSDFVTPNDEIRIRFEVSDLGGASIVEAGLDDFYVYESSCGGNRGDANSDGSVNIGDAVYIINYIFKGGPAPNPITNGDSNCDGSCNIGDAVYLVNFIFRGGPAPGCN
ncbi:MAG: lectin like domain-containing protein [Candidatus Zixiibacteriota bacterium]